MINWVKGVFVGMSLILFSLENGEDIRYFHSPTIPYVDSTDVKTVSIGDSPDDNEVFLSQMSDGTPLHYFIELRTGICFDNKCRPLDIVLYWNITGRYLGFELLDGEFLSKYDHTPFTPSEYGELHNLLADPFLPLGNYEFEELVNIPDTVNNSVDGVSGATSKDVLEFVVEGAAYTTHKLWNVIHGPIREQVIAQTERSLDSFLFLKILQSENQSDRTWALERLSSIYELDELMIDALVNILLTDEYFQSYLLLKSLSSHQLESDYLQLELFKLIGKVDNAVESLIFDKLSAAPQLSQGVVEYSISTLRELKGMQLVAVLKLYSHHRVVQDEMVKELRGMIPYENKYIEKQVVNFLEKNSKSPD
jgi:hypothetical protein